MNCLPLHKLEPFDDGPPECWDCDQRITLVDTPDGGAVWAAYLLILEWP